MQCSHLAMGMHNSCTFLNSPPSFKMECKNFSHLFGKSIWKKLIIYVATYWYPPLNHKSPSKYFELPPKFWDLVPTLPTYTVFLWQHFTSAFYRQELLHSQGLLSNARSIHIFCFISINIAHFLLCSHFTNLNANDHHTDHCTFHSYVNYQDHNAWHTYVTEGKVYFLLSNLKFY